MDHCTPEETKISSPKLKPTESLYTMTNVMNCCCAPEAFVYPMPSIELNKVESVETCGMCTYMTLCLANLYKRD